LEGEALRVEGGVRLRGEVEAQRSKNASLPLMAACLLSDEPIVLRGVPDLLDVRTMCELLSWVGAEVSLEGGVFRFSPPTSPRCELPDSLVSRMRASSLLMGPLLAKYGRVYMSMPGGCAIGSRPIDLHLRGLERLGARVNLYHGYVELLCDGRLKGNTLYLDFPSVGATENLLMAAALAEGETLIENAAREPEIDNLIDLISRMGVNAKRLKSGSIVVEGRDKLRGAEVQVIPDRIEVGTLLISAAMTRGDVCVRGAHPGHLTALLLKLEEGGAQLSSGDDWIRVRCDGSFRGLNIKTMPYPGFPTDLQPQMVSLLSTASGMSVVTENVFDNRFTYVQQLRRMGAVAEVRGNSVFVVGCERLTGASVKASDLRAGAALVIAALAAEGESVVEDVYHIDRGYEGLDRKFNLLGANVRREKVVGGGL